MSSLPAQKGMEGGGRRGRMEARPRADHARCPLPIAPERGGGVGAPDWLVRRQVKERPSLPV